MTNSEKDGTLPKGMGPEKKDAHPDGYGTYPKGYLEAQLKNHGVGKITLQGGEQVLFHKVYKIGIVHRHVVSDALVTNHKVTLVNYDNNGNVTYNNSIPLDQLDDIICINNKRQGTSYHYGISYGNFYGPRPYQGISNFQSENISSIAFIQRGIPVITFNNISDAAGTIRLIKAARNYMLDGHSSITEGMNWLQYPN